MCYYPYLHSTMLSIKLKSLATVLCYGSIYIPLCYLLNCTRTQVSQEKKLIYIPLCYLLNGLRLTIVAEVLKIYIPLCYLLNGYSVDCTDKVKPIYIPLCYLLNFDDGTGYPRVY